METGNYSRVREIQMNRFVVMTLTAALSMCALQAQNANPLSAEVKQVYNGVKNNLLKAADKMPEDGYSFKATPEVRAFGQLVAHVADSQMRGCSAINGEPKQASAASKTTKADLVAALKDSFAECDKAYDSLTDATASTMIKTPRGERSRLGALYGNVIHDNEM